MSVGFIGLGTMGEPMARNLLRAGAPLCIWNRTRERCDPLRDDGARVAATIDELFATTAVVLLMLADEAAVDEVLGRGTTTFAERAAGHTIVHLGTTAPAHSRALERDIRAAGGAYVEAPVSGSRGPAERAELVLLLAGADDAIAAAEPLLAPMGRSCVRCGAVPNALTMKLAINLYMIAMMTGLAEAVNLAQRSGLPLAAFAEILDSGQMASTLSRAKMAKFVARDLAPQAAIDDVHKNTRLIGEVARAVGAASPILDASHELFAAAAAMGLGDRDLIAVLAAIETRNEASHLERT